ncbi:MAG: TraB/GumN family protein [Bacteroidota bacterium]
MSRCLAVVLFLAPEAGVAQAPDSTRDDRDPLLFVMEDEDSRVYLFGSIHYLEASAYPLPDDVEAAYDDAEVVAFEIDLTTPWAVQRAFERRSFYTGGRTLRDAMGSSYSKLEKTLDAIGMEASLFDEYKPWAVMTSISRLATPELPYSYREGVDLYFSERAETDGKPILALETAEDQIDAFDLVPEKAQVQWLVRILDHWHVQGKVAEALVAAWSAGDETRLEALLWRIPKVNRDALLRVRNERWVPQIESYLAREGEDVLVVVGAGHLVGANSVVAMLRDRGYTLTRR